MASGGAAAGMSTAAGTPSTSGGGAGGATAGAGGTGGAAGSGGTPTAGTAGIGGTPPVIVPTVFLIDNVRLRPKSEGAGGEGGAGGAGGSGAGGEGGASETALAVVGGAGGAGGETGEGGAPSGALPDFLLTFDANLGPLAIHGPGFSPNPGGSLGPPILDATTLVWQANEGKPGGAAKVSVPFTVAKQQADVGAAFPTAVNLTGYELLADVKLTGVGDIGECATAWMYVYGANGYANDKSGEPAENTTSHVKKDTWTTMRLDLDGPYGFHTMTGAFKPEDVAIWGIHLNTWGCP